MAAGSPPPASEATATAGPPPLQQPPFVAIATPCFGGQVTVAFLHSMLKLQQACRQQGIGFEFLEISGAPLVTYARNELVARFLDRPHATHLMFIDADVGFEPEQVFRLLRFGADVTAGVYPRKMIDWARSPARCRAAARRSRRACIMSWPGPIPARSRCAADLRGCAMWGRVSS